jgi:hypothetical protein
MPIRGIEGSSPECRAKPGASPSAKIFLLPNQWVRWLSLARVTRLKIQHEIK